jgi:integrase
MATYRGQAEKWINPRIGSAKLKDFKVADAEGFFRELAQVLSKRSLVMVKITLRRSIRRAQKHELIGKNVAELVDLPEGQPGRPSRARTAATHAASENDQVACGSKPRKITKAAEISADLRDATCRACRAQLGIDADADANPRLEALFVLAITLGLRPGELRALTWDHVDLDRGVIHVWRSTGETATPRRRSPGARSSCPNAPSMPSRHTASARPSSGWPRARRGRTPTSSSATKTDASTAATRSTGGSAR